MIKVQKNELENNKMKQQETQSSSLSSLRLWQLISPALPIGSYAYSQGLEYAVYMNWVQGEKQAGDWILGQVENNLTRLDVPVLKRLHQGWAQNDANKIMYWNDFILASRDSSELKTEDLNLGAALLKVLTSLDIPLPEDSYGKLSFAACFAYCCVHWEIDQRQAAEGLLWAWCENQVSAALKLIPLGQSSGLRILSKAIDIIPDAVDRGLNYEDDDIGFLAQGAAIASAKHETQYSRMFRS